MNKPIKYGDLPTYKICEKLLMLSFDSPSKNLSVYCFVTALQEHIQFVENERNKMLEKYCPAIPGKPGTYATTPLFKEKMQEVLDMELNATNPIPLPDLTENDFTDSQCQYPADKTYWMNGSEIIGIIELLEKFKR